MTTNSANRGSQDDHRMYHEAFLQRVEVLLHTENPSRRASISPPSAAPECCSEVAPPEAQEDANDTRDDDRIPALEERVDNLKLRSEVKHLKQAMKEKDDKAQDLEAHIQVLEQEKELLSLLLQDSQQKRTESAQTPPKAVAPSDGALRAEVDELKRELHFKQQELLCVGRDVKRKTDAWEVERLLAEREMEDLKDQVRRLSALASDKATTNVPTRTEVPARRSMDSGHSSARPRPTLSSTTERKLAMEKASNGRATRHVNEQREFKPLSVPPQEDRPSMCRVTPSDHSFQKSLDKSSQRRPNVRSLKSKLEADRQDDLSTSGTKSTASTTSDTVSLKSVSIHEVHRPSQHQRKLRSRPESSTSSVSSLEHAKRLVQRVRQTESRSNGNEPLTAESKQKQSRRSSIARKRMSAQGNQRQDQTQLQSRTSLQSALHTRNG